MFKLQQNSSQFESYQRAMLQLSSPFKIIPFPITCDTLFLTFSPHYEVLHHHFYSLQQAQQVMSKCLQTHRICIIADSYQEGVDISKTVQQIMSRQQLKPKSFRDSLPNTLKLLPFNDENNLDNDKENNSILANMKFKLGKFERQTQKLNKWVVKKQFGRQPNKLVSKALKIKQKKRTEVQIARANLNRKFTDYVWKQQESESQEQGDNLLKQLEEEEQMVKILGDQLPFL